MSGAVPAADHLVHGMGTALEAAAWPAITPAEAEAILAQFSGVGTIVGLSWHSPRPFSAASLVQTSRGEFLLKRHHHRVRTPKGLAEEHLFMAHLRSSGVPVPEVMMANDGAGAVGEGEWSYELHRKAPGLDLYRDSMSWTPFLSHGHAHAAGAALARMHVASRDFAAPARAPQPLVASFTILPASDPLAAAEAYVDARPALAGFLADRLWRRQIGRLFKALAGELPKRLMRQSSLWTHNDWHPSNLLWTPDGTVRTIFDFGLATRTCALHDVATAIERTAIEWLRLGEGVGDAVGDAGAALALLDGYRAVSPLGAADIETITQMLPLVHIEFALSEIDYFVGILEERDHATTAWERYLIGHAEWFLSAPGRDLLARIAGGAKS